MTLRRRLALTIVAIAVPLVAGILYLRGEMRERSLARSLREFALVTMQSGGREDCEADPERFPPPRGERRRRHGPPPHPPDRERPRPPPPAPPAHEPMDLWAYDPAFRSANPSAPEVPWALRRVLEGGASSAHTTIRLRGRRGLRVLTRMPWNDGPCALVMVDAVVPDHLEEDGAIQWGLVALCVGVLGAVLLAVGPIVRRIRRLQGEVVRSAATRYEIPVSVSGHDEVADLGRAFNEAGREVRNHLAEVHEREETLRAFVANTTHDVMIPLTVLQGHLAEQRRRLDRQEPVDAEALRASLEETHYIGSLLHNLGAVAKLEAGAEGIAEEPVELIALVERVVERHRPLAAGRGIELEYGVPDDPVFVRGDVTLLEQAVRNVVHNAVRHNDDGGHVSLLLRSAEGAFSLRVLDDGPGVPGDQIEKLTTRTFRVRAARSRDPNGSGLGLHIAHDIATRHGFSLRFALLDPHGLEVRLEGPTASGPPPDPA